jgi:uroporphyrin-III C-methyltransferase
MADARRRGTVSIVGAGPGDPDLITRRGERCLAEADVVFYDALVHAGTVALATRARAVPVGRRMGAETMPQDRVNRLLVAASRRGLRVVRLKGGDPFVFGRGGEEVLALARAGVPFEVVPGVSSALAAPGLAGIPVTHRGVTDAVLIVSGHDPDRLEARLGATAPQAATLVVLMGISTRRALVACLLARGWDGDTPAAIAWDASRPAATTWTGPLRDLADAVPPPGQRPPGTIVVGEVVRVRALVETMTAHGAAEEADGTRG